MSSGFWLYRWLDELGIDRVDRARSAIDTRSARVRLIELAADSITTRPALAPQSRAILAGRGMDLSGALSCRHPDCQRRQIDSLFSRTWHYFDEIAVVGPSASMVIEGFTNGDAQAVDYTLNFVETLFYIREIGAEDYLVFIEKAPACSEHYARHAEEAGVAAILDGAQDWKAQLVAEGSMRSLRIHRDHWHFAFEHPQLEHTSWGTIRTDGGRPTIEQVAERVVATYAAGLISDVVTAKDLRVPLGSAIQLHEAVLAERRPAAVDEHEVALQLQLPFIQGIPIRELLRLRSEEFEAFERFRAALAEAIRAQLGDKGEDPEIVAGRIEQELLMPALLDIDQRLRVAAESLTRKSALSLGVAAVALTVGLLAQVPLVVGAGISAAAGTIRAVNEYVSMRKGVELADMYFLWRVEEDAAPSH